MFLKRERPKLDEFLIKKKHLVVKENYLVEMSLLQVKTKKKKKNLADPLTKVSDLFCIFLRFRKFQVFLICFPNKTYIFIADEGTPSPLAGNIFFLFFKGSPKCTVRI